MTVDPDGREQLKSLQLLSEVIIQTLKEFSTKKLALTPESLLNALLSKEELSVLMPQASGSGSRPDANSSLPAPENTSTAGLTDDDAIAASQTPACFFDEVKDTYLKILLELGPISKQEYTERASQLQRNIRDCRLMEALTSLGDDLVDVIRIFVNSTLKQIDFTSDFLAELSKQLLGMEEQLFSYQHHHKDSFLSNEKFCSNLLSNTEEMKQALYSNKGFEDTRSFIVSKLSAVKTAIEDKRREDEVRLREADGKIEELSKQLKDYKQEVLLTKKRAEDLEKEALLDSLTEIHNRHAYELRIREELKRYHREGLKFSLMLGDIDHFKTINDLYGHQAGDRCLREIAKKIKSALRLTDFVARYGGEEFIAILTGSSSENACTIAERIRIAIEKTRFFFRSKEIRVTISFGVAEVRPDDIEPETLFARVDEVMYQAKREGRNKVCKM